jgi:type I restriction-modification system DNA methylase subunit
MTDTEISTAADAVYRTVEDYVDELNAQLSTPDLEAVLHGEKDDLTSRDLGSKPETHVQNNLIYPLLEAMGLEYTEEPYGGGGGSNDSRDTVWPDFELDNIEEYVIGENKSPNNLDESHDQVLDYLDRRSIGADYAIATDGLRWKVYRVEQGGDKTEFPVVRELDLRDLLREIARQKSYIAASTLHDVNPQEEVEEVAELFEYNAFVEFTSQTAPQELRDSRRQDVEEFYQLYIEYLFGESDEYDEPTCLMDDIIAPEGTTEHEKRKFAVTLVNRLLFIKFLERNEVVPDGILIERVTSYEGARTEFTGNFYETQIQPLFYDLFNKPRNDRESKHQTGWFERVPFLNGGLFRPNVENEHEYRLEDRTLPDIIRDVVEGERLSDEGRLDPAILGSVFEKTINHIGGETGTQKDVGAYYTPGDVTEMITDEAVDPAMKEVLVETYAEGYDEAVRDRINRYDLSEILRQVEDGEGWFGDAEATREAYDRLGELRVVDPACGSGHFLTTVMEEIHRVRKSLLRGLNRGEAPSPEDDYQSKKELALNSIYGVDVDPIGVEIARLRVWLKIVEDDWQEEFGRLPNIELNIVAGNSLIGLPVKQQGQTRGDVWDDRLDELVTLRREYKSEEEETDKQKVLDALDEIRGEFNDEYLKRLNHICETEVEAAEEWREIVDCVDGSTLHPKIETIKIVREDGDKFSDDEIERLEELGFQTYNYSARLDVQSRHENLKEGDGKSTRSHAEVRDEIVDGLNGLIEDNAYVFEEVERQPLKYDLKRILGQPFHWVAEFPEVAVENNEDGNGHEIEFDIIVGNPPYGNLLSSAEEVLISYYATAGIAEVSAQFVEREIELLSDDGFFGNVTTLRLIYQSSLDSLHDLMYDSFDPMRVACFGFRPSRVFDNAHVRAAIMTGQKTPTEDGEILTSDLLLFNSDNRQSVMDDIEYGRTEGLILKDRIGGDDGRSILPKVGGEVKRNLLDTLKEQSGIILNDKYTRDEPDGDTYKLYKRRGVLYWINPMIEKLYDGSEVEPVWFDREVDRDTAFLVMNSSLYFIYWQTYSNQHHHNWSHMNPFPFPDEDVVDENADRIEKWKDSLWGAMKDTFTQTREGRGDFHMGQLRPLIDEVDELVGELYGLTDEQVEYTKDYLTHLGENSGRAGSGDETLADYSVEGAPGDN